MSDIPSAKRQRTENNTSEDIVRSKIWYDDGSVILQAESTQCRVHWTVLAQHSSFFSDLRTVPQPPDEPRIEGCPIILLSDSIQDLEHLLRALYNPLFDSAENLSFPVVAAIVRLGKKYDFKQLLTAAVARLTATFPRTLADARKPYHIIYRIYDDGGLLFDAINLATEAGLLALLPSLYFYALLELEDISSLDTVLTGMVRDDGTTAKLSLESQIMLIGSRKNITSAQADKMFKWLNPGHLPSEGCPSPQRCSGHRDIITRQTFIPIYCLRQMHKWIDHWDRIFCAECRKVSKADFNDGSQKFWDMLPRFFNLPEWANLENEI